ncbi:MAG: hypothetical protein OXC31_22365 [Spirochaetaceae bacterium]|nr:hypothetical protein [Spirochaetaceae bacterium]
MNAELIAIVAAAIALGTAMLASIRGVRQEVRDLRNEMKGEMNALRSELKGDMETLGNEQRGGMKALASSLRDGMKALEGSLRDEMKALESRLRDEMQAGFKELTARLANIGDRLSKVEGIIEGMFWGARNQPADKPGEGAA